MGVSVLFFICFVIAGVNGFIHCPHFQSIASKINGCKYTFPSVAVCRQSFLAPHKSQWHWKPKYAMHLTSSDIPDPDFDESEPTESEFSSDQEEVNIADDVPQLDESGASANSTIEMDPIASAIKQKEIELELKVLDLESKLRAERLRLQRTRDKVSESGKMGFFMVQAQVADFQKKRDENQRNLVEKSKREFVTKILPILDAFQSAEAVAPPENEREVSMHKNLGSLYSSFLTVIEKYGYKFYDTVIGEQVDKSKHEVVETVDGDVNGIITKVVRKGISHSSGEVIRSAQVVATLAPTAAAVSSSSAAAESSTSDGTLQ